MDLANGDKRRKRKKEKGRIGDSDITKFFEGQRRRRGGAGEEGRIYEWEIDLLLRRRLQRERFAWLMGEEGSLCWMLSSSSLKTGFVMSSRTFW